MNWYCDYADDGPPHDVYHQTEYGFRKRTSGPVRDFRAGNLSTRTELGPDLEKRATTFEAFEGSTSRVAAYGERDKGRSSNPALPQQAEGRSHHSCAGLSSICDRSRRLRQLAENPSSKKSPPGETV